MVNKEPYYSKRTKKEVVFDYENGRASAKELARLYGILGSNTVSDWLRNIVGESESNASNETESGRDYFTIR